MIYHLISPLLHTYPYGVAWMNRLLKITGLFCKRALYKRRYSAKETNNLKEPTNCSHAYPSPYSSLPFLFPLLSLPVLGYVDRTWVIFRVEREHCDFSRDHYSNSRKGMYTYEYIYICMYMCIPIYIYVYVYIYMIWYVGDFSRDLYSDSRKGIYTHEYICIYMYICMYTNICI